MSLTFANRTEAGQQLAEALTRRWPELSAPDRPMAPLVLGLPRGGIVVAAEVARVLHAPLDALVVRKVGHPLEPELAVGAIGPDGTPFLNTHPEVVGITGAVIQHTIQTARHQWTERNRLLRSGRPAPDTKGRTVIVVDDGIATGTTALTALSWLRNNGAARIILAVPVGPPEITTTVAGLADEILCLLIPDDYWAVGQVYKDFEQTGDDVVLRLLATLGRAGG